MTVDFATTPALTTSASPYWGSTVSKRFINTLNPATGGWTSGGAAMTAVYLNDPLTLHALSNTGVTSRTSIQIGEALATGETVRIFADIEFTQGAGFLYQFRHGGPDGGMRAGNGTVTASGQQYVDMTFTADSADPRLCIVCVNTETKEFILRGLRVWKV